ncbi:MAG: lipopolysaccharide assembly protein LapB [Betaproteobacteria bacterium]
MFEWLPWLFLAALACFGSGWLVARVDITQLLSESRALPQSYFKGLNFLMAEQPDKAIEAFIEVTKQQPEAVELQFALGNLFRKRGEVDRAIRIHQSLSERADLPAEQRTAALLELALDFQKAGLLEHAERILCDLAAKHTGSSKQQLQTLTLLLEIYVQERDWQKAIEVAGGIKIGDGSGVQLNKEIANYYCESALQAHHAGEVDRAEEFLSAALSANEKCVRANLLRCEWLAADGKHRDAIAVWRKIEQQNPAYLGLVADQILVSFEAIGDAELGLKELSELQKKHPALDLFNAIFHATLDSKGAIAAYELVKADLRQNPTLVGLDRMLEAELLAAPEDRKADIKVLKDLVHTHSSRLAVYLCANCGFKAKQFYWQCPACAGWETFLPRQTAEYDSAERHLAKLHTEGKT